MEASFSLYGELNINEMVKKATEKGLIENTPERIALLLFRGYHNGINRTQLGNYLVT